MEEIRKIRIEEESKSSAKPKLWTSKFLMVCAIGLLLRIAFQMQGTSLPLYIQYLGGSKATAGLASTLAMVAAFLARPVSGFLVDRYGRKWITILGVVGFSAITLGYSLSTTIVLLLIMRTIGGIASSIYTTASGTLATDAIPEEILGKGISIYGLTMPIAQAFAPSLALMIIGDSNYMPVFYINVVLAVLAVFILLPMKIKMPEPTRRTEELLEEVPEKKRNPIQKFFNMFDKNALPASVIQFFLLFSTAGVGTFLPTYARELGINDIGIYFTVQAIFVFAVRLFSGKLTEKFNYSKVLVVAFILNAFAIFGLGFCTQLWEFLVAGALLGSATGVTMPLLNAAAIVNSGVERRGAANATFYAGIDIGFGVGAYILGLVADAASLQMMFFVSAAVGLAIIPLHFAILHKDAKLMH